MHLPTKNLRLTIKSATSVVALAMMSAGAWAQDVAIVQPGAPGDPVKTLSAAEAATIANTSYSLDDVRFMRDMIPHHMQAVEMSLLVDERSNTEGVVDIAGRI